MYEMYKDNWRPLGEVLAKMEHRGMRINRAHLKEAEVGTQEGDGCGWGLPTVLHARLCRHVLPHKK
jgi:hypothetical protein